MAYEGGGLLRIWNPDLSDRIGAESAMDSAKFGFLLIAGFRAVAYGIAAVTVGISFSGVSPSGLPVALLAGVALFDIACHCSPLGACTSTGVLSWFRSRRCFMPSA